MDVAGFPSFALVSRDLAVRVLARGAALVEVRPFGRANVTLGPRAGEDPGPSSGYAGAVIGPVANRIAGAAAVLDGHRFTFPANEGSTLLHGGPIGLHGRDWQVLDLRPAHCVFALTLDDGAEGFPGNRRIVAAYKLRGSVLRLTLTAETDRPTWINLAQHGYWSMGGASTRGQRLRVAAGRYLAVTDAGIPEGGPRPVAGDFDLRQGHVLRGDEGYDHTFCLSDRRVRLRTVATLAGPDLTMTLATTEPGLQVYDGRGLPGRPYAGIALEPQGWPDAPNRQDFPSVVLRPGETYRQVTEWRFSRTGG
jgi:aldose 1-epimerase